MHPSKDMKRVINGKLYSVETATLLADNEYWDGHNWERQGRNSFLYKTPNGRYFMVHLTQWEGQADTIETLELEEAKAEYELFGEHRVEYEEAFGVVPEPA